MACKSTQMSMWTVGCIIAAAIQTSSDRMIQEMNNKGGQKLSSMLAWVCFCLFCFLDATTSIAFTPVFSGHSITPQSNGHEVRCPCCHPLKHVSYTLMLAYEVFLLLWFFWGGIVLFCILLIINFLYVVLLTLLPEPSFGCTCLDHARLLFFSSYAKVLILFRDFNKSTVPHLFI